MKNYSVVSCGYGRKVKGNTHYFSPNSPPGLPLRENDWLPAIEQIAKFTTGFVPVES